MVAIKGNLFLGTATRVKAERRAERQRDRMARRVARVAALPRPLSDERRALLDAIGVLTAQLGRGPSTLELAAFTGLSRGAVRGTMARLERDGMVADIPKQVRSGRWAMTDAGRRKR